MGEVKNFAKKIIRSRFFSRATEHAATYVKQPDKLHDLIQQADLKAHFSQKGRLLEVWDSLMTLFRMLKAYVNGTYTQIPFKSLISMVASVIYFVMPMDVIPDFLLGFGFLDDAALIAWIVQSIRTDMDQFTAWEKKQACRIPDAESPS